MNELTFQSATKLAKLIRARAVSPLEVVEAYLAGIDRLDPKLNAIASLAPDVLAQAKEAGAALMRGDDVGPLHGLPITIKDTIETRGLLTTSGSAMRATFVPKGDAPAVARLRAAGAIILGKTNAAEMAMDYTADNPVFGRTNNPYNLACTPGGSSGGEAAAIAACMSPVGLGSDLAGSIRVPAHFCGVVGLKPTVGRVPGSGQFPPAIGAYSLGAVVGPMGRYIEDLGLLFAVLAGREIGLSEQASDEGLRGKRFAWYTDDGVAPVTAETRAAVQAAASALADAGLIAAEVRPPGIERGHDLWLKLFSRASVVQLRNVYSGHEEKAGAFVRWRLATADEAAMPTLDEYINSWMERDRLRGQLLKWMNDVPLLLTAVGATNAPAHDTLKVTVNGLKLSTFRAFSYCQTFNVFDLPAVCVPAGRSADGLPIGVQIAGQPFAERSVLAAAAIVERALGGWQPPPIMSEKL